MNSFGSHSCALVFAEKGSFHSLVDKNRVRSFVFCCPYFGFRRDHYYTTSFFSLEALEPPQRRLVPHQCPLRGKSRKFSTDQDECDQHEHISSQCHGITISHLASSYGHRGGKSPKTDFANISKALKGKKQSAMHCANSSKEPSEKKYTAARRAKIDVTFYINVGKLK